MCCPRSMVGVLQFESHRRTKTQLVGRNMNVKDKQDCSFSFRRVSLQREKQDSLLVATIRLRDICKSCRMKLGSSDEPVYVYGCIHPNSLCSNCRDRHQMEIEINSRKAVLAQDLCPSCLVLVKEPMPRVCKVWGGIEKSAMCITCIRYHMLDGKNFMIDPSTLCGACKLLINSSKPDAKPVKGSIKSEAVCNDCKRKSRSTNRECAIDMATLCSTCVFQVEPEPSKLFFVKGSIRYANLCSGCGPLFSMLDKLTPLDLCVPCKRKMEGFGAEIPIKGCLEARRTCDKCIKKIQGLDGTATVDLSIICPTCKEYITDRKQELSVRGGLCRNSMCGACAKKILLPIDTRILSALCDDCLDTIPRCGYLEKRYLCGMCYNKLKDLNFLKNDEIEDNKRPFRGKASN